MPTIEHEVLASDHSVRRDEAHDRICHGLRRADRLKGRSLSKTR